MLYEHGYYQGSMVRNARRIHREHYATIRGAVKKEKLLEWKVQDGWKPLCEFLGRELPVGHPAFPNGNTPAQMSVRGVKVRAEATRRAWWNVGIVGMIVAGLVAGRVVAVQRK